MMLVVAGWVWIVSGALWAIFQPNHVGWAAVSWMIGSLFLITQSIKDESE